MTLRARFGLGLAVVGSAAALPLALPGAASAHGLVGRQDLPIPRWLFAWGAAVVLIASFVGLAVLWAKPRLQHVEQHKVASVPRALDVLAGLVGIGVFVATVYAGLEGAQSAQANLAPTAIYVVFWVGIPFASLLVGDVFRAFNPWRAIGRAGGWIAQRVAGDALPEPLPYPANVGRWPAVLGILAFAWVELVWSNRDDPSQLAVLALVYAAIQLVGMSLYGVQSWCDRADAFSVYFGLFGRLAPLHWRDGGVYARPPLSGAPPLTPVAGTVALLCTMIGTTSFDGFSQGTTWGSMAPDLQSFFADLGMSSEHALEAGFTVGLLAVVFIIAGLYQLGIAGMRTVGGERGTGGLARSFVHTLVPIALAYVIAHYFSLLAYQGQAVASLVSDPLGNGDDLFGTASATINYTWIGATGIWYVQVAALVVGHVCALALAHDRALALYTRSRDATRSQYWMLAVMVAFTSIGLWILSAAAQS